MTTLSLCSSVFIAMNMSFESQPIGGRQLVGTAPTNDATKTTTHIAVACWFAGRVLARPYSVARSKSLHCLCTALAYRCGPARRWKAKSSLSAHASSPRCRMGLGISRGGSRRASMPRLVPTTGAKERGLLTRRVAPTVA